MIENIIKDGENLKMEQHLADLDFPRVMKMFNNAE